MLRPVLARRRQFVIPSEARVLRPVRLAGVEESRHDCGRPSP